MEFLRLINHQNDYVFGVKLVKISELKGHEGVFSQRLYDLKNEIMLHGILKKP